ncbi:hypothetical protein D3C72_2387360 [compost metagenome]
MANELADSPNTMRLPDRMPGIACGSTMRVSVWKREALSDSAACSTVGSSFCRDVHIGITMNGSIT